MAPKKKPVPLNIAPIGEGQAISNTIEVASEWVALQGFLKRAWMQTCLCVLYKQPSSQAMHLHGKVPVVLLVLSFICIKSSSCPAEPTLKLYRRNSGSWTWTNNSANAWKPSSPRKLRLGSWRMKISNQYASWVLEMEEWSTKSATSPRAWSWLARWGWTKARLNFVLHTEMLWFGTLRRRIDRRCNGNALG